jgi:hypothetical protein
LSDAREVVSLGGLPLSLMDTDVSDAVLSTRLNGMFAPLELNELNVYLEAMRRIQAFGGAVEVRVGVGVWMRVFECVCACVYVWV